MDNFENLDNGLITCKGKSCGRKFGYILKHLSQSPKCKSAYTLQEYESLQKESKRITYENNLSLKRSKYDPEKRAKKYQAKSMDKNWMYEQTLQKREYHQRIREKKYREKLESIIESSKQNSLLKLTILKYWVKSFPRFWTETFWKSI